jgi:hypothetical protein
MSVPSSCEPSDWPKPTMEVSHSGISPKLIRGIGRLFRNQTRLDCFHPGSLRPAQFIGVFPSLRHDIPHYRPGAEWR